MSRTAKLKNRKEINRTPLMEVGSYFCKHTGQKPSDAPKELLANALVHCDMRLEKLGNSHKDRATRVWLGRWVQRLNEEIKNRAH